MNITYQTKAKQNLYETREWREVIGKAKSDVSFRSYLVGDEIMLNHQVDKHSLEVTGAWMNFKQSSENNIPFRAEELDECLSMIVRAASSQPQMEHTIGDPAKGVTIRMTIQEGQLKIIRRYRTIVIDVSTPERFEELRLDCQFALQVIQILKDRHRQRRRLTAFLVNNPSPCDCIGGGANHVRYYYYSSVVSDFVDILPLEFVYKAYSS